MRPIDKNLVFIKLHNKCLHLNLSTIHSRVRVKTLVSFVARLCFLELMKLSVVSKSIKNKQTHERGRLSLDRKVGD